ncbi:MAG: dienelactone hydrolase family protein [Gemmatimonadales bacterium]
MPLSRALLVALVLAGACGRANPPAESAAAPDIQTREVEYQHGGTTLKGFIAYDAARTDQRPGVLVVHEWWGHNEHARNQARRLAEAGYVGFAVDMFGDGRSTTHPDTAQAFVMAAMSDPAVTMARFSAALELLKQDPRVDSTRTAAIGYCFGGAVVLGVARAGTDIDAVASFHGALMTTPPVDSGAVKARVLVLNGADDPMIPPDTVKSFAAQMVAAGARFELIDYPGVKHSFTNPDAGSFGMPGLAYDSTADRESWAAMLRMFSEVFPERR